MLRNTLVKCLLVAAITTSAGCSSLGLSLWPAQFPLLNETKEFASRSPVPSGLPHELSKQTLSEYFVEPGDRILIEPTELDSEFRTIGDQKIQIDGSIDLGAYGRLRVAGMTVESIETAIEDRIVQVGDEAEAINVQLIETNAAEVYVLGEVGSPGSYAIDGHETVLDAIVMAGGLTSRASPCDMILVRPTQPNACRVVMRVCYRQITQLGDTSTNYQLVPGDRIVVGSRTLCEELAVWRQTTACECCDRSSCVECEPARVGYDSRFKHWLPPFPMPWRRGVQEESDEGIPGEAGAANAADLSIPEAGETDDSSPSDLVPQIDLDTAPENLPPTPPAPVDDSDIFLPPELPEQLPADVQSTRRQAPQALQSSPILFAPRMSFGTH